MSLLTSARPAMTQSMKLPHALHVHVIRDYDSLQTIHEEWAELAAETAPDNFFATWEFGSSWWEAYGSGLELFVIVCRKGQEVVAIAPLYRTITSGPAGSKFNTLRLIGDGSDDADGFQFLLRAENGEQCLEEIVRFLSDHPGEWDLMELNALPEEHTPALHRRIKRCGWIDRLQFTPHLVVFLPSTWKEYLSSLPWKAKMNLSREVRRAQEIFDLHLRHCTEVESVSAYLDVALDLHQATWKGQGMEGKSGKEERRQFYLNLCQRACETGKLDLTILEANGVPCASLIGFRSGSTRHKVLAGRDRGLDRFSMGTVIHALLLQHAIEEGARSYDFLSGADFYKKRLGATVGRYVDLKFARPRTRAGIWLAAQNSSTEGARWLRTRMPVVLNMMKKMSGRK